MMISSAGTGAVLVYHCIVSGITPMARLIVNCTEEDSTLLSAPCVYRLGPIQNKHSLFALVCTSNGKVYSAACDCDQWDSASDIPLMQIFDAKCGVFCSPAVVPAQFRGGDRVHASDDSALQKAGEMSLVLVLTGRDNMMRCLN
jgi:hypothetical protein